MTWSSSSTGLQSPLPVPDSRRPATGGLSPAGEALEAAPPTALRYATTGLVPVGRSFATTGRLLSKYSSPQSSLRRDKPGGGVQVLAHCSFQSAFHGDKPRGDGCACQAGVPNHRSAGTSPAVACRFLLQGALVVSALRFRRGFLNMECASAAALVLERSGKSAFFALPDSA
jgi:hypothetical protein